MNKKYKILIVFFILFSLLFPTNLVNGATDISYTFDDNILIDSSISDFDSTFNLKNSSYYSGHYNATYSFENDVDGNEPSGWTSTNGVGCTTTIISSKVGHDKVLEITDTNGATSCNIESDFGEPFPNITHEFWIAKNSTGANTGTRFNFYEGATRLFFIRMVTDDLQYYDGGFQTIKLNFILPDIWIHVKLVQNDSSNTFDIYVNNIKEITGGSYHVNSTIGIEKVTISTVNADIVNTYVDAIGYSWNLVSTEQTFDFTNDIVGNEPIGWISNNDPSCTTLIKASLDGQTNVLELENNIAVPFDRGNISTSITQIANNIIEMKITKSEIGVGSEDLEIHLKENGVDIILLDVKQNDIFRGIVKIAENVIIVNEFASIRLELDDSSNTYNIYVNGSLQTSSVAYIVGSTISIDTLEFVTESANSYSCYVDDILINPLYYPIGLNLLPYINSTDFREVDKFEYALNDVNTLNVIGESTYGSWNEVDAGGHNSVKIVANPNNTNDRMVEIDTFNIGDTKGFVKSDFGINSDFVNITFGIDIELMAGSDSYYLMSIESSDFNTHSGLIIYHNGSLNVLSGTIAGQGENLRNDTTTGIYYEANILMDYQLERMIFIWYADSIFNASYELPFVDIFGKEGLAEVRFTSHWDDNEARFNVDYCGVYADGISQSDDFGYSVYNTGLTWNTQINNLLFLQANGTFNIGLVEGSYNVGISMTEFRSMRNYYNEVHTVNGYDSANTTSNTTFVFTILNHYFNISTFKIDGVILKQGVIEYNLELEHSGVDIDESYFYVDTSNRLQFRHIANDTNLEYIQATFDINDVNSSDYAFSFRSDMDNNAYGYIRINYTDISQIIPIPYTLTTTRFLLTQNDFVRDIIILITDKDNNVITGLTTGYIYNVELIDVIDIDISVITESLLNMMIPLIIILVPTFLFSSRFGKQVIVPLFILFSLVLTISGLIPYWLFFIIVFPSIIMVFFKSKKEVV